jgi:hypothetical protein
MKSPQNIMETHRMQGRRLVIARAQLVNQHQLQVEVRNQKLYQKDLVLDQS